MGGEDDGRGTGGGGGGVADAEALESWREPWVGNDPDVVKVNRSRCSDTEAECRASPNMEY